MSESINDITVNVEKGVKELVIRQGLANDIPEPVKVTLAGNIKAPVQFLQKRKKLFVNTASNDFKVPMHIISECNVVTDRRRLMIVLSLNERDGKGTTVVGELKVNPDLTAFGINNERSVYELKALIKLLRHKRVYFSSLETHSALINALSNFTASQQTDLEVKSDRRGNDKLLVDKRTSLTIPFSFKLNMPLYDGFEPKEFFVEILVDVSDASAVFYLESVDLSELLVTERDRIFEEQLKEFAEFVVIEK